MLQQDIDTTEALFANHEDLQLGDNLQPVG